jgi:hypothetical protein
LQFSIKVLGRLLILTGITELICRNIFRDIETFSILITSVLSLIEALEIVTVEDPKARNIKQKSLFATKTSYVIETWRNNLFSSEDFSSPFQL